MNDRDIFNDGHGFRETWSRPSMSDRIGRTDGEYSVCQFFENGMYEYVRRWVSAEEAVEASKHYCTSVAARIGVVVKVIITDGGDFTNFMWEYGKGITYPPEAIRPEPPHSGNTNPPAQGR